MFNYYKQQKYKEIPKKITNIYTEKVHTALVGVVCVVKLGCWVIIVTSCATLESLGVVLKPILP